MKKTPVMFIELKYPVQVQFIRSNHIYCYKRGKYKEHTNKQIEREKCQYWPKKGGIKGGAEVIWKI